MVENMRNINENNFFVPISILLFPLKDLTETEV